MTEQRFTYEYGDYKGNLFDNKMNTFYQVEDSDENIRILCDRLNLLVDENKQLKQFQEQVASVIESKMGDNVCNNYKMEVLKEIWNELELDEVWFE